MQQIPSPFACSNNSPSLFSAYSVVFCPLGYSHWQTNISYLKKKIYLDLTLSFTYYPISLLFFRASLLQIVVCTISLLPFSTEPSPGNLLSSPLHCNSLLKITSDLHVAKSSGQFSVPIFLDLSATFNRVEHSLASPGFLLCSLTIPSLSSLLDPGPSPQYSSFLYLYFLSSAFIVSHL